MPKRSVGRPARQAGSDGPIWRDETTEHNVTLANLSRGERARITKVEADDRTVQRLMQMGLVEGVTVEFIGSSFGGDPLEFRVLGSALSLRRAQAGSFHVSTTTA
jgi:Fe2+ transport system protein FeoA